MGVTWRQARAALWFMLLLGTLALALDLNECYWQARARIEERDGNVALGELPAWARKP